MKVLVLALPRSGTKILQSYLHHYLVAAGTTLHIERWKNGLDEFLSPYTKNTSKFATVLNDEIKFGEPVENSIDEVRRRLTDIVAPSTHNLVIKYPPLFREGECELSLDVLNAFDKVVVLKRLNSFDVALSTGLAIALQSYLRTRYDQTQVELIKNTLRNPIAINADEFKKIYNMNQQLINDEYKHHYQHLDYCEITYDQLSTFRTSDEFCKHLNLPEINFPLEQHYQIEYADNKHDMISNLQELKDIIKE
jgi:hypothetical protein